MDLLFFMTHINKLRNLAMFSDKMMKSFSLPGTDCMYVRNEGAKFNCTSIYSHIFNVVWRMLGAIINGSGTH